MLEIEIAPQELIDEETLTFYTIEKPITLKLEHSLISISKWEAKWKKPFLNTIKTVNQTIDYIRCMTISPIIHPMFYLGLTSDDVKKVNAYIKDPMSATTFNDKLLNTHSNRNGEFVTSELIYYWMVAFQIPTEYEKWHLNRLMNLIKICEIKSHPPKKMKQSEIFKQNAELNRLRRERLGTKG